MASEPLHQETIQGLHDLGRLSADGAEQLRMLVQTFILDAQSRTQQLIDAVIAGDAIEVRSIAHNLAGSSASLGAQVVAEISRDIEARAVLSDLDGEALGLRLQAAMTAAIHALRYEFGVSADEGGVNG